MIDGFIKIAAGTPDILVANCTYNAESINILARKAYENGARILVLPELCLTGYTCADLFMQSTLLDGALNALQTVRSKTRDLDMLLIVSLPIVHAGKLYICAAVLHCGHLLGLVPKTHLPNYGSFCEKRYFNTTENACVSHIFADGEIVPFGAKMLFCCTEFPQLVLGVEICEDLWSVIPPSLSLAYAGATIIANPSADTEIVGSSAYRRDLVRLQSQRLICGYIYANAGNGESTTDVVFSGGSLISENGNILAQSKIFENELIMSEIDLHMLSGERLRNTTFPASANEEYLHIPFSMHITKTALTRQISASPFFPYKAQESAELMENALLIQSNALKKRFAHSHAKTAVIGISGGLDSALALLVTARAMDLLGKSHTDIIAVTMPCFGTTARTKGNAEILCDALGVRLRQIDIKASVDLHFSDIGHDPDIRDVTYENAQARERTQVLMDIANDCSGLVIGTGDMSELALGWSTYNGDHMSMYGVNAGVPKTAVRLLVEHEAECSNCTQLSRVLRDILDTPVSPELLPAQNGEIGQKTEDLVGPYELHDFFIYYAIGQAFPPRKILRLACYAFKQSYDYNTIIKWLKVFYRRFFSQQFKRSCMPDGPQVFSVSLSPRAGLFMPSDAVSELWLKQLEEL